MLKITEGAKEAIQNLLVQNKCEEGGLRIAVESGGCAGMQYGMALEKEAGEEDIVLKADWGTIFISKDSAEKLYGTTVDFTDGVAGQGFQFDNPNAEGKCSCGKSFS